MKFIIAKSSVMATVFVKGYKYNPLAELISQSMFNSTHWFVIKNLFKNCNIVNPVTFASILDLKPVKDLA